MAVDPRGAVVCVTGAARGIGRATAAAFAARGATVWIGDLDPELIERTAEELGANVHGMTLDVADVASFSRFVEAASAHGPIAVLVNNAGIMRTGTFDQQTLDGQHREMAINLGGVVTGMRLVLPAMLARNEGHIVNLASMAGLMSVPGAAVYTATKSGVVALSRAVRSEIVGSRVTITTVLPSAVRTELTEGLDTSLVPTVGPDDVARTIVDSCARPEPEVTLPRWVFPVGILERALPEKLAERVKRGLGTQRRVTTENAARVAYRARTR